MRRSNQLIDTHHPIDRISYKPGLSSLPLQICVHYNALFSLIYAVLIGYVAIDKVTKYKYYTEIGAYAVWLIMEPIRVYYGHQGNLKESVPHMSAFLLMTVFPQLPLVTFLAYFQPTLFPADRILGSFMFIFLIFECGFGWLTIRTIIRSQTAQFMRLVADD